MATQDLKQIIQDSVRETIREERLTLWMALLPRVSDDEMQDIETQFGSPADYDTDEFVDMTDWVRKCWLSNGV